MNIEVRYYSKFGHTEQMVDIIRMITGVTPQSVDKPVTKPVDILYLGCGVMLGKIDRRVVDFINTLTPDMVKEVICFGSCAIIESPVPQMRKLLESKGIKVSAKEFTCRGSMGPIHRGHPDAKDMSEFRSFIHSTL